MADELDQKLTAKVRKEFGKGAARRIRANDEIPAVLYGHGAEPQHLTLPGHKTMLLLRKANALLELDVEGTDELALVKDVQRDPVRQIIEHVDLITVVKGERVEVDVPLHLTGEPVSGLMLLQDATVLSVSAEATHIPEAIEFSIEGMDARTILATDIALPKGTKLVDEETEIVVATISEPQEVPEEETEGGQEEAPAAEAPAEDAE